jgi:16S rRNA (adenine1518-N6/adenine1519-N6)-dimethyltransferase
MVQAKKSLGQNWLKSKSAVQAILGASDVNGGNVVLEIGPGTGILTEPLLYLASKVIAVEKDNRLIEPLEQKFAKFIAESKLDVIEKDILEFDPEIMAFYDLPYKVIANIPYYITGQIIRKFLETKHQPSMMVLLVQKEVGERIKARGKESILSISVKAYGTPKYVKTVPRGAFSPMPGVDSAIIAIENINKDNFKEVREEKFFEVVKKGFGSKRKQLKNNLGVNEEVLISCGVEAKARAEELTVAQWLCLTKKLS